MEVFEREQSIGMLLGRTNQGDRDTADIIAELLGDLPVAVSQAAAMIKRTHLRRLPPSRVGPATSGADDSGGVTGGVYKARERIHRSLVDLRLLAIPAS